MHFIFRKLGFEIKDSVIYIPNHRHDIRNNNDISEEVARAVDMIISMPKILIYPQKIKRISLQKMK